MASSRVRGRVGALWVELAGGEAVGDLGESERTPARSSMEGISKTDWAGVDAAVGRGAGPAGRVWW